MLAAEVFEKVYSAQRQEGCETSNDVGSNDGGDNNKCNSLSSGISDKECRSSLIRSIGITVDDSSQCPDIQMDLLGSRHRGTARVDQNGRTKERDQMNRRVHQERKADTTIETSAIQEGAELKDLCEKESRENEYLKTTISELEREISTLKDSLAKMHRAPRDGDTVSMALESESPVSGAVGNTLSETTRSGGTEPLTQLVENRHDHAIFGPNMDVVAQEEEIERCNADGMGTDDNETGADHVIKPLEGTNVPENTTLDIADSKLEQAKSHDESIGEECETAKKELDRCFRFRTDAPRDGDEWEGAPSPDTRTKNPSESQSTLCVSSASVETEGKGILEVGESSLDVVCEKLQFEPGEPTAFGRESNEPDSNISTQDKVPFLDQTSTTLSSASSGNAALVDLLHQLERSKNRLETANQKLNRLLDTEDLADIITRKPDSSEAVPCESIDAANGLQSKDDPLHGLI